MAVLNQDDRTYLSRFFERALELHAGGVVTVESAIDYLERVVEFVDRQDVAAMRDLQFLLEEAWQEDDA